MLNLDIVSPNRYVNIQPVFLRNRSRAEFCFVLVFWFDSFSIIGLVSVFSVHDCISLCNNTDIVYRESYMSRNEFNNFNNTGARMLDSVYHMTLRLL